MKRWLLVMALSSCAIADDVWETSSDGDVVLVPGALDGQEPDQESDQESDQEPDTEPDQESDQEPEEASEPEPVETVSVSDILRETRRARASRDRVWDLLALPQDEAEATALLRMCASEIEWANERDCLGIYQVASNVRARHCDNTRFGSLTSPRKRITQCSVGGEVVNVGPEESLDGEETLLSALRRISDRAIGAMPPMRRRGRWIRNVTLDCDEPDGWPSRRTWDPLMRRRCMETAELARGLVSGEIRRRLVTDVHPIAWGGRCEDHCDDPTDPSTCRASGACDDRIACRRGLARIPDTGTGNAFWCRVGTRGCAESVDPVCEQFR